MAFLRMLSWKPHLRGGQSTWASQSGFRPGCLYGVSPLMRLGVLNLQFEVTLILLYCLLLLSSPIHRFPFSSFCFCSIFIISITWCPYCPHAPPQPLKLRDGCCESCFQNSQAKNDGEAVSWSVLTAHKHKNIRALASQG